MNARALAIGVGLLAATGVAYATVRRTAASAGEGVDVPPGDDAAGVGDWGLPDFGSVLDAIEGSVMNAQALSFDGLQRLKAFEGFSATPYPDHKGQSIGYGHLIQPGEDLTYLTEDEAAALLASDVAWAEDAVRANVTVPLSMSQFDALVSFTYNVGAGAFRKSTLLRKLNAGDYSGAAAEFPRWNMAGGVVNGALVARRATERQLFEA